MSLVYRLLSHFENHTSKLKISNNPFNLNDIKVADLIIFTDGKNIKSIKKIIKKKTS